MAKQIKTKKQKPMRKLRPLSEADVKLTSDVKRANQRLRELEKQGMENSPAYKAVERLAYFGDKAMGRTGSGQIKFRTDVSHMDYNERRHLEAEVRHFLESETSTTKGVKEVRKRAESSYKEKGEKTRKKYQENREKYDDKDVNWAEWLNMWGTAIAKEYKKMYGSDFTQIIIDELAVSPLTRDEAERFMRDHFGEPVTKIIDAIPHEDMDPGAFADGEGGSTFDWNDLFADADDTDLPF